MSAAAGAHRAAEARPRPRVGAEPPSGALGVVALILGTALLVRLPLVGAWLAGHSPTLFEEPLAGPGLVDHAPFSLPAFAALAAVAIAVAAVLVRRLRAQPRASFRARGVFPWWGWAGLAWMAAWWIVAWAPIEALASLRLRSFTPLWIGYVVVVDALALRLRGACLLADRRFAGLVAASACFWWVFEYLNRFVENWSYHGVAVGGLADVVWYAVLPFATVLPAVATTQHLLAAHPWLAPFARWRAVRPRHPKRLALATLVLATLGLAALGPGANVLFPLLWLAPLTAAVSVKTLLGRRHCLSDLALGDWRLLLSYGTAAMVTGFFWEMWNYLSWPRWTYQIPFVGGAHLFEMPILGYFGYVPFGLECATVAALVGLDGRTFENRHPSVDAALEPAP